MIFPISSLNDDRILKASILVARGVIPDVDMFANDHLC